MRLKNKVALITGAAEGVPSKLMGLGGATAWLFAREGAKIVVADVNETKGQATVEGLLADGRDAMFVKLDVMRKANWQAAIDATVSQYGRLDVLVHAAGSYILGFVESTPIEDWNRQMDIHGKGVFLGTKHAIPAMRKNNGGSVVVI
ncbi:MAG: SDR family NAD(P)-dependent oxidoreductase, partial [Chloroflexi bacterium]|nr:SDR family NAD(P)-dependent oxidoreductase [Chloroflexota bacterium]